MMDFFLLIKAPDIRPGARFLRGCQRQPFHWRQRHDYHRHLRRVHAADSRREDAGTITFPKEFLKRSPGHYRDWIRACKGGEPACSNFNVSAPFAEWVVLGTLALRFEGKLEWDGQKGRITNNSDANKLLKPSFRKGWKIS